jgi:membrane protein DedA with SNARE-associated domain/membrane-associated phospholipid phosphatase
VSHLREHRRTIAVVLAIAAAIAIARAAGVVPDVDVEEFLEDVSERLGEWTYLLVGLLAFAETGAFIGFLAPGEFAVILGGVVAGQGEISVQVLLGIVWFAAWAGDSISFLLGSRLGRGFVTRHGPRVGMTPARFGRVERYFDRHGGKTIVVGRFLGFVRPLAPFIAGSSGMRYRDFAPYSVLGTGLWCTTFVFLGYFGSHSIDQVTKWAGRGTFAFGVLVALVVGATLGIRWLRVKENRRRFVAFFEGTPVLRVVPPVLRTAWRVSGPELRFIWGRLTPGRLGLEFTTLFAALGVGIYVLVLYIALLDGDLGPTPGDATAFDVADGLSAGWLTSLTKALTELGAPYVTWPLATIAAVVLTAKRRWLELSALVAGLVLAIAGVNVIKEAMGRPRPDGPLIGVSGYSFPSGHAAYSTVYPALAIVVARVTSPLAARFALVGAAFVLAAAIGLSRVYLRAHYLSDAFGGWALGLACFALCSAVALVVNHLRQNGPGDAAPDRAG